MNLIFAFGVGFGKDVNDMKTAASCLECAYYRECDVFCYYDDVEDSDDEESEV